MICESEPKLLTSCHDISSIFLDLSRQICDILLAVLKLLAAKKILVSQSDNNYFLYHESYFNRLGPFGCKHL